MSDTIARRRTMLRTIISALTLILLLVLPSINPIPSNNTYAQSDGTLLLNEISPWPSDGPVWVEFINPGDESVDLEGWTIRFLSGFSYTFEEDAGEVVPDGIHVLNIAGENPLNSDGDGCTLSGENGAVDSITWGTPPYGTETALASGPPLNPLLGVIPDDEEFHQSGDVLIRIPNTWPPNEEDAVGSWNWAYRNEDESSLGEQNPYPQPFRVSPEDGAHIASDFSLYVTGCEWTDRTMFQIARDRNFTDVVMEETVDGWELVVENIESGTYYWRVKGENADQWSSPIEFTREPYNIDDLIEAFNAGNQSGDAGSNWQALLASAKGGGPPPGLTLSPSQEVTSYRIIQCPLILQDKDTPMVCLDGCELNGQCAWDGVHGANAGPSGRSNCDHGNYYCARAALSMLAASGGCSLSQDRITYHIFEEMLSASQDAVDTKHMMDPIGDLRHYGTRLKTLEFVCDWIYNHNTIQNCSITMVNNPNIFDDNDPSDMDSIREFIDDGRPVLRSLKRGHTTLVTGYAIIEDIGHIESYWLYVLDPWSDYANRWNTLAGASAQFPIFTFPPSVGQPSRNDEPEILIDSDGDRLFDFDEINRFHTDPNDPDTDDDRIPDYEDILGYVFQSDGTYDLIDPDIDSDGKWKESDRDNDHASDNGVMDGCEDANRNGFYDPGGQETDNFVDIDDGQVVNPECFAGFVRVDYRYSATPDCWELVLLDGGSMNSNEYIHSFSYYYWHELITSGIASVGNPQAMTEYGGEGLAMVNLEHDEQGRYTLNIDIQPSSVMAETHLSFGSRSETQMLEYPLTFADFYLEPEILGEPIRTEDGALKLEGFLDLFARFDPSSGAYSEGGPVANEMSGFNPLAPVGESASAIISWEIWLEPSSWENAPASK